MTLGRALVDRDGASYPMAGLLPVVTSFAEPKLHLGYRQIELLSPSPLGRLGAAFRGHEFHYAREHERTGPPLFHARCARGQDLGDQGCRSGHVAGSFLHMIDRGAGTAAAAALGLTVSGGKAMRRRALLAAGTAAGGAMAAPAIGQGLIRWNMVMPWPRLTPGVGVAAEKFAQRVGAMSGGRLEIKLFAAGELVPAFGGFDAVQSGAVQIAHGTPYYWAGKAPALHWFTGVPFGLTAPELAAWIYYGDGGKLWREIYDGFGVVGFYAGSSGVQAGGWFRKQIETVDDLQGLKFRIAGLGGEVMRRLGAVPVAMPPGEIMQSLTSGAIDAAEWIGPWNDRAFGLYKVAKFYYVPAFHEPGPGLEVIVNKAAWDGLTPDLQAIIEAAASAAASETYADFVYHNIEFLRPADRRAWRAGAHVQRPDRQGHGRGLAGDFGRDGGTGPDDQARRRQLPGVPGQGAALRAGVRRAHAGHAPDRPRRRIRERDGPKQGLVSGIRA